VRCSALQCVAVCCSVLQCVAVFDMPHLYPLHNASPLLHVHSKGHLNVTNSESHQNIANSHSYPRHDAPPLSFAPSTSHLNVTNPLNYFQIITNSHSYALCISIVCAHGESSTRHEFLESSKYHGPALAPVTCRTSSVLCAPSQQNTSNSLSN